MMLQLTMKAPLSLILSLILSIILPEYGTADKFKNRIDINLEGGEKRFITKFKDTENIINKKWQDKSQPVKGIMLNDLLKILEENKDDVQDNTSGFKTKIHSHVHLAKRTCSPPGPSCGHGPGKKMCGPQPPHPPCGPGKHCETEKCNGSGGKPPGPGGYNQKKHYDNDDSCDNDNSSNGCDCKKNKDAEDKKKKCKEPCSCSNSDDSRSAESNENNQGNNEENNKKTRARNEDGWDDADDGDDVDGNNGNDDDDDDKYAQYW
ncbi:uncharacterized protein LOC142326034 [Lycorma delicatula]|uniref:uncharacterized protein LOC142326034 n=1 Tax=Lycorma delicatula TaxID=130591 RepID=UPI003F519394